MSTWLEKRDRPETQLRGKYSEEVVNAIMGLVDEFISYNEQFWNYWHGIGDEVRKLIEDLMSGRAEAITRGEDASGVSIHCEHITLEIDRTSTGGITVCLVLSDLGGVTIRIPDVFAMTMSKEEYEKFINEVLKSLRSGLEETGGFVKNGYASMRTTQIWQAIVWTLLYPGEAHVLADAINVNEGDVTMTWYLRSSHKSIRGKLLNNVNKFSDDELLAFMLTAILGDGCADIVKDGHDDDESVIKIVMSSKGLNAWKPLLQKLKKMGFRSARPTEEGSAVHVPFCSGNAIDLAKAMIAILLPILHNILDALGFEKWERIKRITEMETKWRWSESQVIVAGYKFTVNAQKKNSCVGALD